jgi:4-hydroxy-4-methyl-2-oxoglutarate aldolase
MTNSKTIECSSGNSESKKPSQPVRTLEINDLERVARFRQAGYGGSVSDALAGLSVRDTVLSDRFKPLRQGMQLVGRALPVKLHSMVELSQTAEAKEAQERIWAAEGGHPQKRMMRTMANSSPGSVLCFDCGGDMQPAHFGEMSCQVAYAHGCRGMLIAGNCRDAHYILKMPDFPIFTFGTRPNAFGGWIITEINQPIHLPGHLTHYVNVFPGDYVFADDDGAQIIPKDLVDEVLLRVEEIFEKENHERKLLAGGMPIDEVYTKFGVL